MEQFHGMSDGNINISDVIEVIQTTDPGFAEYSGREDPPPVEMNTGRLLPYVEIVEQPASKALRFRYECEGRSAGSIPGVNSTPENKTFPSIRVGRYKGRAVVVVSCVTKDQPHRPHPHNLVGKEACKKGVCTIEVSSENMTVTFANLGIQCVKKKDIEDALRIREDIRVDPFRTGFEHKRQPTSIDLNAVRLCFQVFLDGSQKGKFNVALPPVVSDPIFDKKAMSDLVICKLSHCSASVAGGMEMILLCEKVAKEDIQVRFFEEKDGQVVWEGLGDFQPTHVHKQTAIAFRTPTYRIQQVEQPVQVSIQLKRPSDGATSEPLPFQMLPLGAGRPAFWSLRKAFARKKTDYSTFSKILATESALLSNVAPKFPRNIDEYNNNNDFNMKNSNNKISALRALNDLFNVRNTLDSCNGNTEINQSIEQNTGHTKNTIIDYENNEVPIGIGKSAEDEQINKMYKIDHNYLDKETNDTNSGTLTCTKSDSTADNMSVLKNTDMSKNKSDWFDYSEVGKWVQKGQMSLKEKDIETDFKTETTEDCNKSFNELLTQVAELDQIYADTHAKLVQAALEQNTTDQSMDIDVCDNQTYTSLQMAMKNPIEFLDLPNERKYEDVCVPKPNPIKPCPSPPATTKRDGTQETEERLPPLPPKRIRKMPSMPLLPRPISAHTTPDSFVEAPNKNLPSLPGTLTKSSKQGLFSKLFAKKAKKDKDTICNVSKENSHSLNTSGSISYLTTSNIPNSAQLQIPRVSGTSTTSVKSLRLDDDESPSCEMELTEAEHYALYTAMAPHATASEFDEMSFYYSPVEGGKIYSDKKET
ncbi:Embryonic polarity protein dorsal [Habropoda laboriosa]|uniref:Embryonic polarity protein dorsal n=1 Tax=Habropoda laboriosa TaxID=597456 RepID=A0A0L7RE10_9HYME|nr:Embryonic polarity protein dorsal [Habropoda laboriosa]